MDNTNINTANTEIQNTEKISWKINLNLPNVIGNVINDHENIEDSIKDNGISVGVQIPF